jgi:hypothetical protein
VPAPVQLKNFNFFLQIADIVAVNGQPAKGTLSRNSRAFALTTAASPGQAIADTVRGAQLSYHKQTRVGTVMSRLARARQRLDDCVGGRRKGAGK